MEFKRLFEEKNRLEILKNKNELTQEGLEILSELVQVLQLTQSNISGETFIAISKEIGKGYVFDSSEMNLWINDESVDIYKAMYYR